MADQNTEDVERSSLDQEQLNVPSVETCMLNKYKQLKFFHEVNDAITAVYPRALGVSGNGSVNGNSKFWHAKKKATSLLWSEVANPISKEVHRETVKTV